MCWLFVWKDGKQQLVQQIPSNISPDLMTYIAQNSGGNYGWSPTENMAFKMNNSSGIFNPFAKAHCVAAECSVVRVNPPLPTRDQMADGRWQMADGRWQMADFAGFFSTQAGRFGAAAAAAGVIPGPHTLVAESAALMATFLGLGAGGMEQLLRPNPRNYLSGSGIDIGNFFLSERFPLFAPVINETAEAIKNSPQMQ